MIRTSKWVGNVRSVYCRSIHSCVVYQLNLSVKNDSENTSSRVFGVSKETLYVVGVSSGGVNVIGLNSNTVLLCCVKSNAGPVPDLNSKLCPRCTASLTVTVPILQGCIMQW
jgi:hypothetical protein